jgi:hypothetical protein
VQLLGDDLFVTARAAARLISARAFVGWLVSCPQRAVAELRRAAGAAQMSWDQSLTVSGSDASAIAHPSGETDVRVGLVGP